MFKNSASLTRHLMKPFGFHLFFASLCSVFLGLISSFLVTLIGPSVLALTGSQNQQTVFLKDLIGEKQANEFLRFFPELSSISIDHFFFYLPLCLVLIAAFKTLFQFSSWYTWEWLAEGMAARLRHMIVKGYLQLAPEKRSEAKEEDIAPTLASDSKLFREYIVHFYGGFPRELIQVGFMLATQYFLSPRLTLIFFLGITPMGFLISYLGKKVRKRSSEALENYSSLSEWLQQRLLGLETIKHYRCEEREIQQMEARSLSLTKDLIKAARSKAKTAPLLQFIAACSVVVVLTIALVQVQNETLSGAVALSFFSSVALLIQSAGACGRYYNSNREASAALDRLRGLLNTFESFEKKDLHESLSGSSLIHNSNSLCLELCSITARHPGQHDDVLKSFSYRFKKNKIYAVTGSSGSGKSTLFQVILGLLPPRSGEIFYSFDPVGGIAYMPQSFDLATGTVAQQVCYPAASYDEAKVRQSLEKVGLLAFLEEQHQGIHTLIGAEGTVLSGGQSQRLLLARLFYIKKSLILIDEGTSALDPQTERDFYQSLKELSLSSTIIMIAHRPAALEYCDENLMLKSE